MGLVMQGHARDGHVFHPRDGGAHEARGGGGVWGGPDAPAVLLQGGPLRSYFAYIERTTTRWTITCLLCLHHNF
jgi:hypothetical protein